MVPEVTNYEYTGYQKTMKMTDHGLTVNKKLHKSSKKCVLQNIGIERARIITISKKIKRRNKPGKIIFKSLSYQDKKSILSVINLLKDTGTFFKEIFFMRH